MEQQVPNGQYQPPQQPMTYPAQAQQISTSGMAIAGFVLGIIGVTLSFIPIINNAAFFIGALGVVFAIVGISGISKGKAKGKGLAITGIILGIFAIIITIAMQATFSAAFNKAFNGDSVDSITSTPASTSAPSSPTPSASASSESSSNTTDLSIGSAANLSGGLSVTVTAVMPGLANYDGDPVTGITVTYVNNGSREASFNPYDWKAQDAQGAQRSQGYYSNSENELSSGSLAPGGTVTGNIYFDGSISKALYYSSMLSGKPTASWTLS